MIDRDKFEVIILSAFGRQAELPATNRIYSLLEGFYENGIQVHLITPDLPLITETNLSNFKVHVIKKGLVQRLVSASLAALQSLLEKQTTDRKRFKPVYQKESKLLSYYSFFFYSKTPIPIVRTYLYAKNLSKRILKKNKKPIIITSVAPGCYLLVGVLLKKYFKKRIIWIADYQDPLEENPLLNYKTTKIIEKADTYAFQYADCITVPEQILTETLTKTAKAKNLDIRRKCFVLKPGITKKTSSALKEQKSTFSIIYGGTIYREQIPGLKALLKALKNNANFKFIYAGFTPEIVRDTLNELNLSGKNVEVYDLLPRSAFENLLEKGDVLLALSTFAKAYNVLGSKIYSLLGYDKPLLIIAPKNKEIDELAKKAGGVYVVEADEEKVENELFKIQNALMSQQNFRSKKFIEENSSKENVRRFIAEFLQEYLKNAL